MKISEWKKLANDKDMSLYLGKKYVPETESHKFIDTRRGILGYYEVVKQSDSEIPGADLQLEVVLRTEQITSE